MAGAGAAHFISNAVTAYLATKQQKEQNEQSKKRSDLLLKIQEEALKDKRNQDAAWERLTGALEAGQPRGIPQYQFGDESTVNTLTRAPDRPAGMRGLSLPEVLSQDPMLQVDIMRYGGKGPAEMFGAKDEPKEVQLLRAAGVDPMSTEGRQAILTAVQGKGLGSEAMMALQATMELLRIEQLKGQLDRERQAGIDEKTGIVQAIEGDFFRAKEMMRLMLALEDTALASGVPYGQLLTTLQSGTAAIGGLAGFDVSKMQQTLADRQLLLKYEADGTLDSITRLRGTGTITDVKWEALAAANPSSSNQPSANAKLLANRLEAALDAAKVKGIPVPGEEEKRAFVAELRAMQEAAPEAVVDVPETAGQIREMTQEQLDALDIDALRAKGKEFLEAARDRQNELKEAFKRGYRRGRGNGE